MHGHCFPIPGSSSSSYGVPVKAKSNTTTSTTSGTRQPLKAVHSSWASGSTHSTSGNDIRFYNRGEPYYEFTNFYPCNVFIDGKNWPTTEHYFQAQKFVGTPYLEKIRKLPTPRDAFQLSRDPQVSRWRRADWESVKDDVMLKALRVKFSDNLRLRTMLIGTCDRKLIEHTANDSYWGDGGNGTGQNQLGKLLMRVRRELSTKYGSTTPPYKTTSLWSYDDSAMPRTASPQASKLRRSNSFSNIADRRSYSQVAGNKESLGSHGYGRPHQTPYTKPISSQIRSAQRVVQKGVKKVKQGAAAVVTHVTTPSSSRSNTSSVDYNIITNMKHTRV